jgi:hypothetical protein
MKKIIDFANQTLLMGVVYAQQEPIEIGPGEGFEGLENIQVGNIIPAALRILLIAAAVVALVFLIIGGIKWITSGGDKAQVESARGTVTSALIGLMVVLAAWALLTLVSYFFGVNVTNFDIPTFT